MTKREIRRVFRALRRARASNGQAIEAMLVLQNEGYEEAMEYVEVLREQAREMVAR